MAVVSNNLIGRSRGSAGGITFATILGQNIMKNKATSVANPRTGKQVMQRAILTLLVAAFRAMPSAIDAGFKKGFAHMSPYNRFAKANMNQAFDTTAPPVTAWLVAKALISKGTIGPVASMTAVVDVSTGTAAVTYDATITLPGQSLTDNPIIAVYNSTLNEWTGALTADLRSDGASSVDIPISWAAGNVVRIYLGFSNPLTGESSDSINITGVMVA